MKRTIIAAVAFTAIAGLAYAQPEPNNPPPESALADYPGFGHRAEDDMRAYAADEARRQQLIFQCMRAAGFEYFPETAAVVRNDARTPAERRRRPTKSRNELYRESLPADRLPQYNMTLFGVLDPNSETELWNPNSATGGGCWGEALRSVRGVFDASRVLTREYVEMRRSVARDPRVTAAEANWSRCMAGRGHEFGSLSEFRAVVYNQGEVPGRPRMAMSELPEMNAASEACLAEAAYADAERAARIDAENAFVRNHKATLDRHKHAG